MFDLLAMYPEHLHNKTMREILNTETILFEMAESAIDELINEFFIDSSYYSLDIWSKFAGIEDDPTLDVDIRRSNIKAALKAKEVTTVEVVKAIAESYSNGRCDVIEDYNNYKFTIKFISVIGVPAKINEIKKIIDKAKPAHLNYDFEFRYRTWDDIKNYGKTYDEWKNLSKSWEDLKGGEL